MSSLRWRSESPPIVLLGAIRQCERILLTFTRPYFGTARSMSKTLAVSTYSGGSSSSEWIERRPAFRWRWSGGRLMRISLARASASILWLSDRSGAVDVFDVGPVAVTMGGESTHPGASIKKKRPIHLDLRLSFTGIEAAGRSGPVFAGFFTPSEQARRRFACLPPDRGSSRCRRRRARLPRRAARGRAQAAGRPPSRSRELRPPRPRRRLARGRPGGSPRPRDRLYRRRATVAKRPRAPRR